ncbi:MAG: hypothetical protein JW953_13130 [Anaerolineae bacterium]|nr:hypothetical protein [Anaerolineae bacterium]
MLTPEYIVTGLGILLVVWYLFAAIYNRRFGLRTYRWLQRDLEVLGDKKSVQASWLGSSGSGARIGLQRARAPFRRLELTYLLESRELAPLWLVDVLRGKRDQLILRGTLRHPQGGELEIIPAGRKIKTLPQNPNNPWTLTDGPHHLVIAQRGAAKQQIEWVAPFLESYGSHLIRFSWGPQDPHILIMLRLAGLQNNQAAALFQAICRAGGGQNKGDTKEDGLT